MTFDSCYGQSVPPSQVVVSPDRCFEVSNAHNSGLKGADIVEVAEEVEKMQVRDFIALTDLFRFPLATNSPDNNELPVILGRPQLDLHSSRPNFSITILSNLCGRACLKK